MKTFLTKLSQLDAIHEVILLSTLGELLFCNQQNSSVIRNHKKFSFWNEIIAGLEKPLTADFLFAKGRYYLLHTDIGYVIIGMNNDTPLKRVKTACTNVQTKLSDPIIRKKTLLKMLADVDDMLKPHVIKELVPLADRHVAHALVTLLQKEAQFKPEAKENLLLFICQALGHCSTYEAVAPLQIFLSAHTNGKSGLNSDIVKAAQISLQQLELDLPVDEEPLLSEKTEGTLRDNRNNITISCTENSGAERNFPEAQRIRELLSSNRNSEALSLMLQLVENCSRNQHFEKAEELRDWLIEIDPMALMEIVRAAEIIEEEKKASISKEHLTIWKNLSDDLSPEDFSALYHAATPKKFQNGEILVHQGEFHPTLFFINRGRVQLYAVCKGREVPLKVLEQGEIIGAETFFEVSAWTVSAKSMGAEMLLLSQKKFQSIKDNYPALESKLLDFCARSQSVSSIFRKTGRTRRRSERENVSGRVTIALLDKDGENTGIGTKGDLLDMSKGGISFCLHASQKNNAFNLLGKTIKVTVHCGISTASFIRTGVVRAVRGHDLIGNQYSLHVELDKQLSWAELQQAISANQIRR